MNDVAHYVKMRKAWPVTKVAEFPGWAVCVLLAVTGADESDGVCQWDRGTARRTAEAG